MNKPTLSVTEHLKRLAEEQFDVSPDGHARTRSFCLAEKLWEHALGATKYDPKTSTTTVIEPEKWAMVLVLDRTEGKVGPVAADAGKKAPGIAERIDKTRKQTLNQMAEPPKGDTTF